jgi:CRP-like cAMP-binding protein
MLVLRVGKRWSRFLHTERHALSPRSPFFEDFDIPGLALLRKLTNFTSFSEEEKQELERLATGPVRHLEVGQDAAREGDRPVRANLIVEGWAARYYTFEDGRRQITGLLFPGDICDVGMAILAAMDHSITAVSPLTIAEIAVDRIEELRQRFRRIDLALQWNALVEAAIARQWVTSLGQRSAAERLAHLFCEIFVRLEAVGLTSGAQCEFPLTQQNLADVTGLSAVHVNRTLMKLRGENLIVLKDRLLVIPDLAALQDFGMFDATYLHLAQDGGNLNAAS